VENRGAWIFAGLGLVIIALLMLWMGKTLDRKAPIRIDRVRAVPTPDIRTLSPEEAAAREDAEIRSLLRAEAAALSTRAAAQVFPSDEVGRVQCTLTGASPVHRDGATVWWDAEFSCVDRQHPEALPNPTAVSVRFRKDGTRWAMDN
jgi:hypothetical protein